MEKKNNANILYMNLISEEMTRRKLRASAVSQMSGVPGSKFTRLKQGHDVSGNNLFQILKALDLINIPGNGQPGSCAVNCDEDMKPVCRKVKDVIESSTPYSVTLKTNIDLFHEAVTDKMHTTKMISNLSRTVGELTKDIQLIKKTRKPKPEEGTED